MCVSVHVCISVHFWGGLDLVFLLIPCIVKQIVVPCLWNCICAFLQLMFLMLCLLELGRRMFSADNTGLIIVWKTSVNDSKRHQPCHRWCIEKVQEMIFVMFYLHVHIIQYTACAVEMNFKRNVKFYMFCLGRKLTRLTSEVSLSTCCSSTQTGAACLSMPKTASSGWWTWECKQDKTKLKKYSL